jgi:hypothetical protein
MRSDLLILLIIEIIILVWGFFAVGIANYMVSKEELRLQQERQNGLKIHTVYKDCFCEESGE